MPATPIMLKKGDIIGLPPAGTVFEYAFGRLEIQAINGKEVTVAFHYSDGGPDITIPCTHDLASGPLTIGRKPGNTLQIPDKTQLNTPLAQEQSPKVSGVQAIISLDNGAPVYLHNGTNDIRNPLASQTPEMIEEIVAQGGDGGGFTHENRRGNPRDSNEDRGGAYRGPTLNDKAAKAFLKDACMRYIGPRFCDQPGGSTLSMAMQTREGHVACSIIADSPIYVIAQNPATEEIKLVQVSIPHNRIGHAIREELKGTPPLRNIDAILDSIAGHAPQVVALAKSDSPPSGYLHIYKNLGQGTYKHAAPEETYTPDTYIVNPAAECPQGFVYKGMLVCSDGINEGVREGVVQKALQPLFAGGAQPKPTEISKAAVNAAITYSCDNVSAVAMPANAESGTLIAIADGNHGTAKVAVDALECLQARCRMASVTHAMDYLTVTKNKNEYRVTLNDQKIPSEVKKDILERLSNDFKNFEPERSYQMGVRIVRETLTVKNPPPEVKKLLDTRMRDQDKGASVV